MLDSATKKEVKKFDALLGSARPVRPPAYDPLTHYLEVGKSEYFKRLVVLRHIIKLLCDGFMSKASGAINADLFMLTPSVSSPMGPGSDSEAIPIKFGTLTSFLTDSSQFGFEPIVLNGVEKVYCYLPSMRGEKPDKRHLNQFFHCEAEIRGDLEAIIKFAEDYVRYLSEGLQEAAALLDSISMQPKTTAAVLKKIAASKQFQRITFDEACDLLSQHGFERYVNETDHGRDISSAGELELMKILKTELPIWLTHFDRDRVPFYQKPDPSNPTKVLNADLLFPSLIAGGFGGEILGAGQRQDKAEEMYASLEQQDLSAKPYEWYINLRRQRGYKTTSGFGLGIERYLAWSLGFGSIQDVILYPRLKNILTTP